MSQGSRSQLQSTKWKLSDRAVQWSLIVAFYLIAALWGARSSQIASVSALDTVLPLASAVVIGWWAIGDSIARGNPIPLLARGWFVLLANLTVPGYLVASRGWRGVAWLLLNMVLTLAVFVATFVFCQILFLIVAGRA